MSFLYPSRVLPKLTSLLPKVTISPKFHTFIREYEFLCEHLRTPEMRATVRFPITLYVVYRRSLIAVGRCSTVIFFIKYQQGLARLSSDENFPKL